MLSKVKRKGECKEKGLLCKKRGQRKYSNQSSGSGNIRLRKKLENHTTASQVTSCADAFSRWAHREWPGNTQQKYSTDLKIVRSTASSHDAEQVRGLYVEKLGGQGQKYGQNHCMWPACCLNVMQKAIAPWSREQKRKTIRICQNKNIQIVLVYVWKKCSYLIAE